jgi:hypothetical protein
VVNRKTAKALAFTVPLALLTRADEAIEKQCLCRSARVSCWPDSDGPITVRHVRSRHPVLKWHGGLYSK